MELFLNKDKSATWTNSLNYRNNDGKNFEDVTYKNYTLDRTNFLFTRFRDNQSLRKYEAIEYT